MSNHVIIAPTTLPSYRERDPANIPIVDTIKDQTDSVNVRDNIPAIIPDASAIPEVKHVGPKHYYDMRAPHQGNAKVDGDRRARFFEIEKSMKHGDTSYPNTGQSANSRYLKGLSNT